MILRELSRTQKVTVFRNSDAYKKILFQKSRSSTNKFYTDIYRIYYFV